MRKLFVDLFFIFAPTGPTKRGNVFQHPLWVLKKTRSLLIPESHCILRIYVFRQNHVYQKSAHNSPRSKAINAQYPNEPRDIAQYKERSVLWE